MSEAIRLHTTPRPGPDMEAAVYDLTGVASLATLVLDALHEDPGAAQSKGNKAGLAWLRLKLAAAGENLLAIHESRATTWHTMSEVDDIQEALERAEERGAERKAQMGMGDVA